MLAHLQFRLLRSNIRLERFDNATPSPVKDLERRYNSALRIAIADEIKRCLAQPSTGHSRSSCSCLVASQKRT